MVLEFVDNILIDVAGDDLFVYNDDWFGLLRSFSGSSGLSAIYPDWIHNHEYHSQGWW